MRIEAYLLCWNEIDIMPFIVQHYQKFCDHIVIYDNYSTDGSDKLAESMGCEVRKFGTKFFDDQENINIKNNCWKGSDADYCIIADFDEILCGSDEHCYLDPVRRRLPLSKMYFEIAKQDGTTIFKTQGWQIMSDQMPKNDLLEITTGYEFNNYSKSICFSPKAITEIQYNHGAHKCSPTGQVKWSEETLYVLHYKHIGGLQRTIDRYKILQKRLSKNNRRNGWGIHYNRTPASLKQEWNERMTKSKPLI